MQDLPSFLNHVAGGDPLKLPLMYWNSEAAPKDLQAMLLGTGWWEERKYHSNIHVQLTQNSPDLNWQYGSQSRRRSETEIKKGKF